MFLKGWKLIYKLGFFYYFYAYVLLNDLYTKLENCNIKGFCGL